MHSDTSTNFIIIGFLFILILCFCLLVALVVYPIVKFIVKKTNSQHQFLGNKYLKIYLLAGSVIFSLFHSYTAVYPMDQFYFEEFSRIAQVPVPSSAKIINKQSSYPDLHGDYFSKSSIELSNDDFHKLLEKLQQDKTLVQHKSIEKKHLMVFERKRKGKSGEFLYIYFLKDHKTIEVSLEFT